MGKLLERVKGKIELDWGIYRKEWTNISNFNTWYNIGTILIVENIEN